MKKLLSILIALVMFVSVIPIGAQAKASSYNSLDVVELGSYPQTQVSDENLISKFDEIEQNWISYGYYSGDGTNGSAQQSDYMKYSDFEYNGLKYRAVTFSQYRPVITENISSADSSRQDDFGYYTDTVYYFKWEPIKWYVSYIEDDSISLKSTIILDSQPFNSETYIEEVYHIPGDPDTFSHYNYYSNKEKKYYANDYEHSSVKEWVNNDFKNAAFNLSEQNQVYSCSIGGYTDIDYYYYYEEKSMFKESASDYAKIQGITYGSSDNTTFNWLGTAAYSTYYAKGELVGLAGVSYANWNCRVIPNFCVGILPGITLAFSGVKSVTPTSSVKCGYPVNLDVSVYGNPSKIRFATEDGYSVTMPRESSRVNSITVADDYEIWNVTVPMNSTCVEYDIYTKYADGWFDKSFKCILTSEALDTSVDSVDVVGNYDGVIYQGVNEVTVKTGVDVTKVQFMKDGNTWTYSVNDSIYNDKDGVRTWSLKMNFCHLGDHSYQVRVRSMKTTFEYSGHNIDVTVYSK